MEINENSSRILSIVHLPTPYSLANVFLQFLCEPEFLPKISSFYFCSSSYLLVQFPKECCQFVHSRLPVSKPGFRCPKPGFRCQNQASGVQKPPLSSGIARHEIACDVSLKICKKQYLNHPQVMNLIEQVLDNAVLSQHDLYFEEYR